MNIKKITAALIAVIMILTVFASCEKKSAVAATKEDAETVMTIGKYEVRRDLYNYFLENFREGFKQQLEAIEIVDPNDPRLKRRNN